MAKKKKRCGKCACCRSLQCETCGPGPVTTGKKGNISQSTVKNTALVGMSPDRVGFVAKSAADHSFVHRTFAEMAAKDGNAGLAYNEANDAYLGVGNAQAAADHLKATAADEKFNQEALPDEEKQCCLKGKCKNPKCPLVQLDKMAADAQKQVDSAKKDTGKAFQAARGAGPNPNIPGIPSDPNWTPGQPAYPGGPVNPFTRPTTI